ncbi:MAG TPA: DNA primase [Acidimicrobiia bacterium]|nr:DNA primase [Acidimicrobiia bacterium]
MAFSDEDRDRIRAAVSIADLVAELTTVKRSGRNHMAICVFHQEKTPSMSLDVARGLYKCHGCQAAGDIFTFVQETQGLTFPEAMEWLARRAGITLSEDPAAAKRAGRRRALVDVTRAAMEFYHSRLMGSADAGHARSYLRGRGYDSDTVIDFRLGYAPGGDRSDLVRELRARGFADRVMIDAGLARRGRGGGAYDYFHDRLMFPTWDIQGEPVGFGGRILGDGQPKYLNTPETPIYKKSRLLYGLDRARREIQRAGYAVVVEGYTDVISLHRNGVPMAVATNGTALGDDHFELLRRFADRIVLAFDADAAGSKAARRGEDLDIPVRLDLDLRVAEMPRGVDPADMVQQGRLAELDDAIARAKPLLQAAIEHELTTHDLTEPESRARALKAIAPRIARVTDDIARAEYARFAASRLGVDLGIVEQAVGVRSRRRSQPSPGHRIQPRDDVTTRLERELLRSVLADGGAAATAGVTEDDFSVPAVRSAFRSVEEALTETPVGRPVDLPAGDGAEVALLIDLATDGAPADPIGDVLARVRDRALALRLDGLTERIQSMHPDDQGYSELMTELVRLRQARKVRVHE